MYGLPTMQPYRKYFTRILEDHYPREASKMIAETDDHYNIIFKDISFAVRSPNPIDRRLDFSAYFLALIKTLSERRIDFNQIRKSCLEIVTEYVRPKNRLQGYLKKLPAKLTNTWIANSIIRKLNKRMSTNPHPDGFVANIITDKEQTFGLGYGFDILECGICKLFAKHQMEEYVTLLCEVDEITSGLAGLQLIRSGTIARGANCCDFRFKKEAPPVEIG